MRSVAWAFQRRPARQRIRHDLVLGYWDDMLGTTPEQLQARIDNTLMAIKAPFLAVFGHILDPHEQQHLRRLLPSAEVDEWPDRGHLLHLAEPGRFARRLAAFAHQCFRLGQPDHPGAAHERNQGGTDD